jgi:hypothetical protein
MTHPLKRDKGVMSAGAAVMLAPVVRGGLYQEHIVRTVHLHGEWLVYGAEQRRYLPVRQPELADRFSKCDTPDDLLAFVQEYGPLGFAALGGGQQGPVIRPALGHGVTAVEPTVWGLAHAATVRWCLETGYAVQKGRELPPAPNAVGIGAQMAFRDRRQLSGWKNHGFWDAMAFAEEEIDGFGPPDHVVNVIEQNLANVQRTLDYVERRFHAIWHLPTLLDAIYLRTADMVATGTLVRCAALDCGRYFMRTNPKERYCPNPPGYIGRERLCAVRDRQRRARERVRVNGTVEKA